MSAEAVEFIDLTDRAWRADALCAQVGGDMWHPDKGESTRYAKAICARCPVIEECLQWALDTKERFGVLGGKSERERRKIMREAAR